jgi:hypothetical protein
VIVWICYAIAGCLALLGAIVLPESVREARRISRLGHEGRRLAAKITRIDEVSESTNLGSVDRAQYGDTKIVDYATVRYAIDGTEYQTRHRLPDPSGRYRLGDRIAIVVLPDAPNAAMPRSTSLAAGSRLLRPRQFC